MPHDSSANQAAQIASESNASAPDGLPRMIKRYGVLDVAGALKPRVEGPKIRVLTLAA